jgi:hypothetical protein
MPFLFVIILVLLDSFIATQRNVKEGERIHIPRHYSVHCIGLLSYCKYCQACTFSHAVHVISIYISIDVLSTERLKDNIGICSYFL